MTPLVVAPGRVADRMGAGLSDAAGSAHRAFRFRRRGRHYRPPDRAMAVRPHGQTVGPGLKRAWVENIHGPKIHVNSLFRSSRARLP